MPKYKSPLTICTVAIMLLAPLVRADEVQVSLSKDGITDRRTTDTVFGSELRVGLKVKGEAVKGAYSLRPIAKMDWIAAARICWADEEQKSRSISNAQVGTLTAWARPIPKPCGSSCRTPRPWRLT